ncbi:sigma-70 family RNA polymerase sigma factor [Bacillus sp. AK128]
MQSKVRKIEVKEANDIEKDIEELYPKIQRYCQILTQNCWDRDDLSQEALLKLWSHYRHAPVVNPALLNKMAHNKWMDILRKQQRETIDERPINEKAIDDSENIHARMEVIDLLTSRLTPKQAVIFTLKEGFQYQINEIAQVLHTTEEAVKAGLIRAKQRLEKYHQQINENQRGQYWDEGERDFFSTLLYKSLMEQDPSELIQALPFLPSLISKSKSSHSHTRHNITPSNTVYMAA